MTLQLWVLMFYREKLPRPELRAFINCFWTIQPPAPLTLRDRTFPDGCQEIVFCVDTTVQRKDGDTYSINPAGELVGQMTRPYDIITRGRHCVFGVKFYPHSFAAFTRESVYDLRDQSIDLHCLLQPGFARVTDVVLTGPSFETFVALMEDYFLCYLAANQAPGLAYRVVDRAVRILLSEKAQVRLESLPQRLGVSERYLQITFKRHVGLSPKQLSKMIRFQTTFRYLHDAPLSLTDIAQRCGYYDHAHFVHDFKTFAGVSPSAYRKTQYPLNRFFLATDSHAYLCDYKD